MSRTVSGRTALVALVALALAVPAGATVSSAASRDYSPGAPGVGDPYFPRDGNGGYDARHYGLKIDFDPGTGGIQGVATIRSRARANLSSFDLDLVGLDVSSVRVDGRKADWHRDGKELVVDPAGPGIKRGHGFVTEVTYDGVPQLIESESLGAGGWFGTDDGALVAGQPHAAASWYPVNDHPSDKASYTFEVTAPTDLQVVANGVLAGSVADGGSTTWTWQARDPMASYLTTIDIGHFDVNSYERGGLSYADAVDPRLDEPVAVPRTGSRFALSQRADSSYKRLSRTISVPADGGELSFWVNRQTEQDWDYFMVEAHPVGSRDWTTLPDRNGHTSRSTGNSCPYWLPIHPFLRHYQTAGQAGGCRPHGTTGVWRAATGSSDGYEHWVVDLDRYAGSDVQVSLSTVSDDVFQLYGAFVDDVTAPGGVGSTSFEDDGDAMDGWHVTGPPTSSPGNENNWIVGTADDTPASPGAVARKSFAREPEIVRFLAQRFGPYPFEAVGGIVDREDRLQFALETQTRPVYASAFFVDQPDGDSVVVHELAHQWYGDSVRVRRWRHIWLNEGFAQYAEWMWSAHEGGPGPKAIAGSVFRGIPRGDPFWDLRIGDPGPDRMFDGAVYLRGAMTVQALRERVGGRDFFRILRRWPAVQGGGTGTTARFEHLAERISGKQLDKLFRVWLFTAQKPPRSEAVGRGTTSPRPHLTGPAGVVLRRAAATGGR